MHKDFSKSFYDVKMENFKITFFAYFFLSNTSLRTFLKGD
jgi:hypothetical protein